MMKNTEILKVKLTDGLKSLLKLMLAWGLILILITCFELLISAVTRAVPDSVVKFLMLSFWNNLQFWIKVFV